MSKLVNLAIDAAPRFKCHIPSINKSVEFRAFLVKEQKLLLIAKEDKSNPVESMVNSVVQIISNCCLDHSISVQELPSFDIEYIFIQLWRHSTANQVSRVSYACQKKNPDSEEVCGNREVVEIDLKTPRVDPRKIMSGVIEVNSSTIEKLIVRYPSFSEISEYQEYASGGDVEASFDIYGKLLKVVYKTDGELLKLGEDYTEEDAVDLMEHLPSNIFNQITKYVMEIPTIEGSAEFKCSKCGNECDLKLHGLSDFF